MPLINGCKYSCEPCIRGHRATSCQHNDRILIEVRKPGRPLESCGHEFATCTCGKMSELLSMGTVIPNPAADHAGQNPAFVVTSPPLPSVRSKSNERTRSHHRVSKKAKKGKGASSPMSPSTSRGSRETSTMLEESEQSMSINQPSYTYQAQNNFGGSLPDIQQPSFPHYPSPPYQAMQSSAQGPQPFNPYQGEQTYTSQNAYQMGYSAQPQDGYTVGYSSRIEDIAHAPNSQEDDTTPNVRSQYIMARQNTVWRAT